jgi:ATP-dependent RNA helicase MSS116
MFTLLFILQTFLLILVSIAQARTGTGKTLGFLIPVVQNILSKSPELAGRSSKYERGRASDIRAIIISPTRELAEQIAVEAKKITGNTGIKVQVAVGGNSKQMMLRQMQREGCHLLVATPGRLNDLLTDPYSRVAAPNLSMLVLDEADRLLDAGFADEIEDIMKLLPDISIQDRQTLLFSATVPKEVMGLVRRTLKEGFKFVQTIQKGELATHEKVPQNIVSVSGLENLMPALLELSKREIEKSASAPGTSMPFKALVYFSSTANVELAASIFQNLGGSGGGSYARHPLWPTEISNMHGKLSQQQRTRVSDRFRRAKSAMMFSSDVTARGMDFPNVTHVIQIGLPPDRDQYIHRVGRTGRGDKSGQGWLFITDLEIRAARRRLQGLPLKEDTSLEAAKVDMTQDAQLPAALAEILTQITNATKMVDRETKVAAYMANIGVMASLDDKQRLIDVLNQWTRYGWGWDEPPSVSRKLADMLGLSRVRGIVIGQGQGPRSLVGQLQRGEFSARDSREGSGGGFGGPSSDDNRGGRGGFGGGRGYGGVSGNGRERSSYGRDRAYGRRDDRVSRERY